ncbi:MAG: AtpZ/AtpI family protein [Bdellovibrionales bacterium]|nr:AtpZ/AtpI family protein [Bdellovibrionales bacterium]
MVARAPVSDQLNFSRKPKKESRSEYVRGLALLAWVSWEILALTALGVFTGWSIHRWLGGSLLLTLVFGVLGLSLAFYRIYLATKKLEKSE